ncbi:D-alanyl-D-alanine carboxypeptidase/D-alanyl-D-alanine-endopeptidase [Dysgonomonas sp. BGC7]|uniref:D-alanyl-D-alanine carboxypeptidase/D-alanyl-D-alanine endopeptidase n=1 Tax=Dysgonomonas sp. BGC7 TaxID=1658008 RepID=UPI000681FDBF|nr:D-alanyl-D-alanine carboxypeptidase/D-alanyl-D-alanine-endopeptidase [Dysgonomonas sp. BGC7]MBD8387611.1 D-alanyl-D-alanine carboxypeptidase/D-alanyl-D-alanine-endopeptidase [Dysgonomonas sp. BGC7]
MKTNIFYSLIFFLLVPYLLSAQSKETAINTFINNPQLKHASIGICVKDLSGKAIVAYNADKSYTPASVLKVVTTATALEILGEDYRYKTNLGEEDSKENHIIVHGYGDPTLGTEHLNNTPTEFLSQWVQKIKSYADTTKPVDITVIDDYFGYEGISQRWIYQDMGNYYAAATYGISIFDNTYNLYFNTMRRDTCPVIVRSEPEINLSFHNTMTLNTTGRDNGYIHGEPLSVNRLLTGNIPAGRTNFRIKGDIPNPGLYLGEMLAERLSDIGFTINKVETSYERYNKEMYTHNRTNIQENVFYTRLSYPLKDIVRETNVRSNNHYAEHLIRTIGRARNADIYISPLDEGVEKVKEFWKTEGLDTNSLSMFDGSGLAPSNAVSPLFMCDLLVYMQTKSKYKETFLHSLPQAGKEGTVLNRLKGTRLVGKVYMKSGSIYGVQCFSGYYINGEKRYAFTVMVNKFTGPRSQVIKAIDKLLLSLF